MTNFIEKDTEELKLHMISCERKHPIVYIINSHFIEVAKKIPNHIGALTLIFVLLMSF